MNHAVHLFKHPVRFAFHVLKDLIHNGVQIYHDIHDAIDNYHAEKYYAFGENCGEILEKVLVGYVESDEPITTFVSISKSQVAQIVNGVLKGALEAEGADDLEQCLADTDLTIEDLNKAYNDLKLKTASGTADGLKDLGEAMEALGSAVQDCAGVKDDWATIVNWAHTFTSPRAFAFHIGKDILVNGVDIYNDIEGAVSNWEKESYEPFGEDVGDALAKIIVGMEDMYVVQ